MTSLYNCRHSGDQYRITKFDTDMNVESTYTCTTAECDCPAGVRPTCRHRDMLPRFIQRQHIGDEWFFDYDRGGWVQMGDEWAQSPRDREEQNAIEAMSLTLADKILPEGVTLVELDPLTLHNALAEALSEPMLSTKEILSAPQHNNVPIIAVESLDPASPAFMKRRFL